MNLACGRAGGPASENSYRPRWSALVTSRRWAFRASMRVCVTSESLMRWGMAIINLRLRDAAA